MLVNGKHYRTIWLKSDDESVIQIIDQRHLPHHFIIEDLHTVDDVAEAIKEMHVRGAGLIGATAGYGMLIATRQIAESTTDDEVFMRQLSQIGEQLKATRPTAVNLEWAVKRQLAAIGTVSGAEAKITIARETAQHIADEDAAACKNIGEHGLKIIQNISQQKNGNVVNILTHCNAGWLAFVDYGSATAPIYAAHDSGINVHVWVDETRPRNQGARLTAWELGQHNVPHTIIADNVGGHLMQHGMVDMVITGADRVTYTGDAANKIGTYLKALAAKDNDVPFYVALPSSTFDWQKRDGLREIPIEERGSDEVHTMKGVDANDTLRQIRITPKDSPAANYGFDVTPARLITGLITESGICEASENSVLELFPEKQHETTST
ncbi:MAG: S-methyl-5-thioribose-1-phosphate isomerase [Anaerolineae bacterium]|nr:S-methyl-5-thioribose-1-phosphate isomerase [Anaerolineae bacterium]MDQ7034144.1 S-methyl-5-thioribose-1-phosphate isomerase [Anaerolineae bacterium]